MILEAAVLNVRSGEEQAFEDAFRTASPLIAATPGYIAHKLQRCLETKARYLLLVQWETLEAHTVNFRQSANFQQWKQQLHHFYDPHPVVEHYEGVLEFSGNRDRTANEPIGI
jgi:heme-degrading monooxygenase HmoA